MKVQYPYVILTVNYSYCTVFFYSTRFRNILYTMYHIVIISHIIVTCTVLFLFVFVFNSLDITNYNKFATKRSLVCLFP